MQKKLMQVAPFALSLWAALALLQYRFFGGSSLEAAVRSLLYTGGCFVSIALLIPAIANSTRYNFLVHRRTLGVLGFSFMISYYIGMMYLSHNGLLLPSLAASGLSFLGFIGEL